MIIVLLIIKTILTALISDLTTPYKEERRQLQAGVRDPIFI